VLLNNHLGLIRMTVDEGGEVASADDYDPWGLTLNGRSINNGQDEARWKFIGEEKDAETGDYWFGVRGYDARIGRFHTVDALDELSPHQSPYVYANNNPIFFLDPSGLSADTVAPTKTYQLEPVDVIAYRGQMSGIDWIVFLSDFHYSQANIDYDDVSESWVWYY